MKKFFTIAASLLLAVGCTAPAFEENINNNESGEYDVLYAAVDDETSKVFIDENRDLSWNADDAISVWGSNDLKRKYTFMGNDGDKVGAFKTLAGFGTGTDISRVYALYPYDTVSTLDATTEAISHTIPAEQTYTEGTVAAGAAIMTAIADKGTIINKVEGALQFKNAMSFLRVSLKGEGTVTSVAITANSGEALAGNATISHNENNIPVLTVAGEGASSTLTLNCGEGVELSKDEATTFWLAVRPVTLATGLTVKIANTNGDVSIPVDVENLTFERNKVNTITREFQSSLYFAPGVWEADGAWFAAYFFNSTPSEGAAAPMTRSGSSSAMWVKMTYNDAVGVYECQAPQGYNTVTFCRMDSAATEMKFDHKWNQTGDITFDATAENYESNNCYYVTGWEDDNHNDNWGEQPYAPATENEESVWSLSGAFNKWGDTVMKTTSTNNIFVAKGITLDAYSAFKVRKDNAWDENYGGGIQYMNPNGYIQVYSGGSNLSVTADGTYDIYFDYFKKLLYVVEAGADYTAVEKQTEDGAAPKEIVWALTGSFNDWSNTTMTATGTEKLFVVEDMEFVYGTEIKVKDSDTWDTSFGGGITNLNANNWMKVYSNGSNVVVAKSGTYDVYFEYAKSGDSKLYLIEANGDYTTATEQTENGVIIPDETEEVTPDEASVWSISGTFNSWGDAGMVTTTTKDVFVAKSLKLDAYVSFKVRKDKAWTENYGGGIVYMNPNGYIQVYSNGSDISITTEGTYDIYFDYTNKYLYVVTAGADYTAVAMQTTEGAEPEQEEPEVTANMLYLKPNSNWTQANARFAAYFFGGTPSEVWVSMTDSDGDGIYEVNIPEGYDYGCKLIFCRMNPGTTANNWSNKWNQTSDLTAPTDGKNLYTVKDGTWDKGGGTWSTK